MDNDIYMPWPEPVWYDIDHGRVIRRSVRTPYLRTGPFDCAISVEKMLECAHDSQYVIVHEDDRSVVWASRW